MSHDLANARIVTAWGGGACCACACLGQERTWVAWVALALLIAGMIGERLARRAGP